MLTKSTARHAVKEKRKGQGRRLLGAGQDGEEAEEEEVLGATSL